MNFSRKAKKDMKGKKYRKVVLDIICYIAAIALFIGTYIFRHVYNKEN